MSGLYTNIVANCLFPVHERLKKHTTVAVKNAMEQSQWWSQEKLQAYQLQRLQALLQYAEKNVPYYTRLFKEQGFNP